jgi:tripartite-type tricarboxylate transporter receptor subunit TctC
MRLMRFAMLLAVLGLILAACGTTDTEGGEGSEDTAAPEGEGAFYEGKVIRFVTSSGPGGGTDVKIRTLGSQLPRFIEGNPATQVSNIEPHVAGMNFVWNAEPDGLTVGLTAAPTLEFEFFEEAEWDSSEWSYIGAMTSACDNMLLVRGDAGYETIEDAMGGDEPLITMTQAPTPADVEPIALSLMLVADYLDLPLEVRRVADAGQGAINLAMERGEINAARYGSSWCLLPDQNPGWLEDGFVIPLLDMATRRDEAAMPEVVAERPPHVSDVLTEEQYEEFRGVVAASREGGNPFFMPPDVPEETLGILRTAFNDAVADEDFVEAMEASFGAEDISFYTGEEIDEIVTDNLQVMTEYSDRFTALTEELYAKYVR